MFLLLMILVLAIGFRYTLKIEASGLVVARSKHQATIILDDGERETFLSANKMPIGRCSVVLVGIKPFRIIIQVHPVSLPSGGGGAV